MPKISLGTGSSPARFGHAGATRHINCVWEPLGEDSKDGSIIIGSDGLDTLATMDDEGWRASIEIGAYMVAVVGRSVYRVDSGGGSTRLGGIPTTGPVFLAVNRRDDPQVGVFSDGLLYVIDTSDWSYTQVDDPDLQPGNSFDILDGYGIVTTISGAFQISSLDDFTAWDALEFASNEFQPDADVCVAVREGEAVFFGTRSTEWWRNTGDADFAFANGRVAAKEFGCLCAGSVCKVDGTLAFIAHDGTVRLMRGYEGQEIGIPSVHRAIASVVPSTIRSFTWWNEAGHKFYALSSPGRWTWVYNLTTGKWHERESKRGGVNLGSWRVGTMQRFLNRWYAGDIDTGELYEMSPDTFAEGDDPLVMTVQTPPIHGDPQRLQIGRVFLQIIPGVGLATGEDQDITPEIMVQWSDNGGHTWSSEERIPLGALGDYDKRGVPLSRQGTTTVHGRTYRFSISAAVARAFIGASVEAEALKA